jgi:hypothetical protein
MRKQRHSGFAQFLDDGKRDQFIRAVLADDAILTSRAYVSGSRPTIVFDNLTAGEQKKVVAALEGLGRWIEDVQFEPMGGPSGSHA